MPSIFSFSAKKETSAREGRFKRRNAECSFTVDVDAVGNFMHVTEVVGSTDIQGKSLVPETATISEVPANVSSDVASNTVEMTSDRKSSVNDSTVKSQIQGFQITNFAHDPEGLTFYTGFLI